MELRGRFRSVDCDGANAEDVLRSTAFTYYNIQQLTSTLKAMDTSSDSQALYDGTDDIFGVTDYLAMLKRSIFPGQNDNADRKNASLVIDEDLLRRVAESPELLGSTDVALFSEVADNADAP